ELRGEIFAILKGAEPWDCFFHRMDYVLFIKIMGSLLGTMLFIGLTNKFFLPNMLSVEEREVIMQLTRDVFAISFLLVIVASLTILLFRPKLFPKVVFLIGNGISRYNRLKAKRKAILTA